MNEFVFHLIESKGNCAKNQAHKNKGQNADFEVLDTLYVSLLKKHPGKSLEMPGCPLGWSADDGHEAPVPIGSQAFFRENRELTWF